MTHKSHAAFDPECKRCPRLARFLADVRREKPSYFAKPVPSFGDEGAQLLVIGLAPGMHGANRTGRPFTGDHAGILLYETLHKFGFSNRATGDDPDDGLQLHNCRIINAVKCLPPRNKPSSEEINTCNQFLRNEIAGRPRSTVLIALGMIAHGAVLSAFGLKKSQAKFAHGAIHEIDAGNVLIDSYHCSRYNTQTKRLTTEMFHDIFASAAKLIRAE